MDIVEVNENTLNLMDIYNRVKGDSYGGISIFVGTTRNNFDGKEVVKLEYEAHNTMAEKEMNKICHEIRQRWKVGNIAIVHRVGVVPVSESSVVIAVSSEHRKEAIEAVDFGINTLKAAVPIWKKEVYRDGGSSWKDNANSSK